MKDKFDNEIKIGNIVAYAPAGAYAGISIGTVRKITDKQIGIEKLSNGVGRHVGQFTERLYYTQPTHIIIIDELYVPDVT
jgi:hypothetical protein